MAEIPSGALPAVGSLRLNRSSKLVLALRNLGILPVRTGI